MDEAFPDDLDPYAARVLAMARAGRTAFVPELAERRKSLDMLAALADEPCDAASHEDIILAGAAGPLACRVFTPRDHPACAVSILYLHGGGWTAGGLGTHSGFCGRLAVAAAAKVYLLNTPLAPEHPFPAALEAAAAALHTLHQNRVENIVIAGDSAGGNLALALTGLAVERAIAPLARLLLIAPITDVAHHSASRRARASGWFVEADVIEDDLKSYLKGGAARDDPRVSPLLRQSFVGFPPVDLHLVRFDPFFDEGESLASRLVADGVKLRRTVHEGMIHYFWCLPRAIPQARAAATKIGAMLREDVTAV